MINLILFNLFNCWRLLGIFLLILFVIGSGIFLVTRNFKIKERKNKNIWIIDEYGQT